MASCSSRKLAISKAFSQCFSILTAKVLRLLSTKKLSKGLIMDPMELDKKANCSAKSSLSWELTTKPPITSE